MFGRKIFETFAAEFMSSHLAEGTTVSELSKKVDDVKKQLAESQSIIATKEEELQTANKKAQRIAEATERAGVLAELLGPLSKDKRELMGNLLESVATTKLQSAYNKYLPTVLNESTKSTTQTLKESQKTEITGNKAHAQDTDSEAEIINLRKLAGIN